MFLSSYGIKFWIIGPRYLTEFDPLNAVVICRIPQVIADNRHYYFFVSNSPDIVWDILLYTLYNSIGSV